MKSILPFSTNEQPGIDQVGGKALSLISMTRQGMPVPPGFVLTVEFFQPWIIPLQATAQWKEVQIAGKEELGQAARDLQSLCMDLRFDPQQQEAFDLSLGEYQASYPVGLLAVRSSSPDEDLESASFAGAYETTLGVRLADLPAAILHSFASSLNERVLLYKKEHGFPTDQLRIAVIIQQQVDADQAGVAFSLNPLNNCFDEAVINANFGLGESIVAGAVDPDVFIVDKITRKVSDTKIGVKQVVTTINPNGGTTQKSQTKSQQACLTPTQVLNMVDLLTRVETFYKYPVDIEWAISKEKLYLLQARPITTYLPLPEVMVTTPGQPKRLYANSTLIEQGLQEPLSVLGTDFIGYVLKNVGGSIGREAIGPEGITFTASGGYYMNISYALKMGMRNTALAPGSFGDPRVLAILDSIDMKQYLSGELPSKLKALRSKMIFNMLPMVKSAMDAYLNPERLLGKYHAALPGEIQRIEKYSGGNLSLQAQAIELSELLPFFYGENGIPMILAAQLAQKRIEKLFTKERVQVRDHLINLGISLPDNKTTQMGEMMYTLAASAEIDRYESAVDFIHALQGRKLSPEFTQAWEIFMDAFGMRCPGEIDPATPRPKEQPALFFEQLKNMSLAIKGRNTSRTFFEEARARRAASYRILYEIALRKGKNKAKALEKYYKIWVMFGGYRETPKHYVIKVVDLFRGSALAIAQNFVRDDRLDTPEQIFNLTIADIDRAYSDPALDLRALARERTVLINKIKKSKLVVRVIDSRGKIFYPPINSARAGEFNGVPISPGVVQGRVRVLHNSDEKKLLPGEILVARATDPGWTPLFINARGIILEIGGALQHGAVVAREYGIPCVSGLDDATSKLKDDQLVEVDGSRGIVRIL